MFNKLKTWYLKVITEGQKQRQTYNPKRDAYTPTIGKALKAAVLIALSIILGLAAIGTTLTLVGMFLGVWGIVALIVFTFITIISLVVLIGQ